MTAHGAVLTWLESANEIRDVLRAASEDEQTPHLLVHPVLLLDIDGLILFLVPDVLWAPR